MRRFCTLVLMTGLLFSISSCGDDSSTPVNGQTPHLFLGKGEYLGAYWPTDGWRSCQPEEVGMDSDKLVEAYEFAADASLNTEGLVIVKDGYIVGEAYFGDFGRDDRHYSYSVAKSFASAVIGIAIERGDLDGVNQPVYESYPEWQEPGTDSRKQQITIRHLLTMTSGIEWNEDDYYEDPSENDAYEMHRQHDAVQYVLDKPMSDTPGERWYYSTGNSQLFSGLIEKAVGQTFHTYARARLLLPLGLGNVGWDHDPSGHTYTGSGIRATVREYAKFGYLYLNEGLWEDEQVVPQAWVHESTRPASGDITIYGYQWWLKRAITGSAQTIVPDSTYLAWGIYTQQVIVIPEENIVIARVGNDPEGWSEMTFLTHVLDAIED